MLLFCLPLGAAVVTGRVVNDRGEPVAGAHVVVSGPIATGKMLLRTDEHGAFEVRTLPAGTFQVQVLYEGYFPLSEKIESGADPIHIELSLTPRELKQALDVVESLSTVDPQQTAKTRMLTLEQIDKVPYQPDYDFRKALATLPGVSLDSLGRVHVNGGNVDQTLYLLDGFNLTSPVAGGLENTINLDAVQVADVRSSRFSAEYGKASAGVVSVTARSGDDRFRQQLSDFIPSFARKNNAGIFLKDWAPRFVLSGPVVKGRVWFMNSIDAKYDQDVVPDLPPGGNRANTFRWSDAFRLQAQIGPSHLVAATFFRNSISGRHVGLDLTDPVETTRNVYGEDTFFSVKDQRVWHGILSEMGFALNRLGTHKDPQGDQPFIIAPDRRYGNYFLASRRSAERQEWLANFMAPPLYGAGRHEFKFGVAFDRILYNEWLSRRPYETRLQNNLPWRRTFFEGSPWFHRNNLEASSFIQDRWSPVPRFLVELGLRQDWDKVVNRALFAPRVAVSVVPWAGRDIKLSAGVGIFYDATNLSSLARSLDQRQYDVFYRPDGTIQTGPVETAFLLSATHPAAPRTVNWSAGWEQKLAHRFSLRTAYLQRNGSFGYTFQQFARPQQARVDYLLRNARHDVYRAYEVSLAQNYSEHVQWSVSYTRSLTWSNAAVDYTVDNPFFAGQGAGPLNWDTPNRLLASGWTPLRKTWTLAYLAEWRDGMPFSLVDAHQQLVGAPNTVRYPRYFSANVHIEHTLRVGRYRWALRGGVNNVTGHNNFSFVDNNINSPTFLRFSSADRRTLVFRVRFLGRAN